MFFTSVVKKEPFSNLRRGHSKLPVHDDAQEHFSTETAAKIILNNAQEEICEMQPVMNMKYWFVTW